MIYDYKPSPNKSPRNGTAISMIVLHATVGDYTSALAWLRNPQPKNPKARVSTHYLIRKDGHTAQLVVDDMAAWHAGSSAWRGRDSDAIRDCSLGVELENANDGIDPYPTAQLNAARDLCKSLVTSYHIARVDLVRHLDVATPKGRKTDPANFPFAEFVASVYARVPAPAPATHDYDVIGLPIYQRSDRSGPLYGYLLPGAHVTIDDLTNGHLSDSTGFVDINGLVVRPL